MVGPELNQKQKPSFSIFVTLLLASKNSVFQQPPDNGWATILLKQKPSFFAFATLFSSSKNSVFKRTHRLLLGHNFYIVKSDFARADQ